MPPFVRPAMAGLLLFSALGACTGDDPVAPSSQTPPPVELAQIDCRVTVATGALRCTSAAPGTGDASALIVGGQGSYVSLSASNFSYDAVGGTFGIDVTVQNLIPQPLGTADGATPHGEGVRIFFAEDPMASDGSGLPVSVANATDVAPFLSGVQPYFQYDEVLSPNETSNPKPWLFSVPVGVASFSFKVYVSTRVQFPNGWVDLTPAADTMVEGGTQALTATVRNVVGTAVSGTVTFGTSDPAVGTVDAAGLMTAVAPGRTTITATSGQRSGSATLAVCPNLAVGGVYTATMPGASSICFGEGEYAYMPVNLSSSSSLSLSITGSGIIGATGQPSPSLAPRGPLMSLSSGAELERGDAMHMAVLERDRRLAAELRGRPGARIGRTAAARGGARLAVTPGTPALGDLWNLNVASGCSGTPDLRTGRVVSIGQRLIIVADTANPAGGFTTAQYDSIRLEFDSLAWPVNTANFGEPTDTDNNQRVVAFFTRGVNEMSPPATSAVNYGYFFARDLYAASAEGCTRSNVGEILYMLVPDPTGAVNSNVRGVSEVRGRTSRVMAHELQHLINASRRVYLHDAPLEEGWLNEGLSSITEELMFYRTSVGLAPRGNIVLANLTQGTFASRRVAAFNTYSNDNFTRLRTWLQRPDTSGAFKSTETNTARGANWAFLRYAADRRNGDDATLWFNLVNTTATGTANLQTALGVDPNEWLRDFTSAMYVDDAVAGIGPAQQVTSWNFRSLYAQLGGLVNVYGRRDLSNGTALTLSYSRGGGTAFTRFGVPTGGFAGLTALSGGVPPTSPFSLIVVRTK
ncbi:Ig-like domain-containing protein [Longimicrobium sp.]|uniref:Ig-like domain-containing protein n=1 Tax=Longimicrobium sp. TaxID=2029185 RepID=UPI003B3B20EE